MNNEANYAKLTQVFHDVFDDDTIIVSPELTADDVDEWDSLTHIRLVMAIEKSFGLKFSAAEVEQLRNVGDLVTLIDAKKAA
jgi:acyl carrier protein